MTDELVAHFTKRFPGGAVIEGRLRLPAAGFSCLVLFGPSGCGKTTILRCLAGLERPETGKIRFGREIWCDAERKVFHSPQAGKIGFVFQDLALFPHLTVADNVGYGLRHLRRSEKRRCVAEILERLKLAGLADRYPHEISGGQQQRVALARSLVRQPRLLLLDEPLAALDSRLREQVRRELRKTLEAFRIPTVIVTHDRLEALALADELVLLDEGRPIQAGPAGEVFAFPVNAAAARIVGFDTVSGAEVLGIEGSIARVRVENAELFAALPPSGAQVSCACIRAEHVMIEPGAQADDATTNRLRGRVLVVTDEGPLFRVELDCGFRLAAVITRSAKESMTLTANDEITVRIAPSAIRLISMS